MCLPHLWNQQLMPVVVNHQIGEFQPFRIRYLFADSGAHLFLCRPVATYHAFDAYRFGCCDDDQKIEVAITAAFDHQGGFFDGVGRAVLRLLVVPGAAVAFDSRMNERIQSREFVGVLKNNTCYPCALVRAGCIVRLRAEQLQNAAFDLRIVLDQPFCPGVGIVHGHAQRLENATHGAFATADTAGDAHTQTSRRCIIQNVVTD